MDIAQLKEKALQLPMVPGVYLMRDRTDKIIYVGKAKKLKNRVSQYFQDTASHSSKTRIMVSKVDHFEVIVAASEFEALVLECSLIKRYMPKYNILLKDGKGYPYIRLDTKEPYPRLTLVSRPGDDGAGYYGPFGSRGVSQELIDTIGQILMLPQCNKKFPRDIGKGRPCLHYHMGQCQGWCQRENPELYTHRIEQARQLLLGNYKKVAEDIRAKMLIAAEELNFELAAQLRNQLNAVDALNQKQTVTAGKSLDTDVIGFASSETMSCFTVLHYSDGNLIDKDYELLSVQENEKEALSSLVKQYYFARGFCPRLILLPWEIDDMELFSQLLSQEFRQNPKIKVPQKGDNARLIALAQKNAYEEAQRVTSKEDRLHGTIHLLGNMLSMGPPKRIESYDISNISGTDIVAGMIVFCDGKPAKSQYKRFKIKDLQGQDDYASMQQVLTRRFEHYLAGDAGFTDAPDLVLIDGGMQHAEVACKVLRDMKLDFPVYGMVKDDRHRTRALITAEGKEIAIDHHPFIFSFIGTIQEETHRFAITYHRQLRSKRLHHSALDQIPGIGPKRKQLLLRKFKSITAVKNATLEELRAVLPKDVANEIFLYFKEKGGE